MTSFAYISLTTASGRSKHQLWRGCRDCRTFGCEGSGCVPDLSFASVLDCCGCCLQFVRGDKKKHNHFNTSLKLEDHVSGPTHLGSSYQLLRFQTFNLLRQCYNLLGSGGQHAVLTVVQQLHSAAAKHTEEIFVLGAILTCFAVNGAKPHT